MMPKMKTACMITASAAALTAALVLSATQPAEAQQQVAALDHVAGGLLWLHDRRLDGEDRRAGIRRRIHRHRPSLRVPHRCHERGDERQRRNRLHGRHRHDPIPGACRRLQGFPADQARARAHLVLLSDGIACWRPRQRTPTSSNAGRISAASRCSTPRPVSRTGSTGSASTRRSAMTSSMSRSTSSRMPMRSSKAPSSGRRHTPPPAARSPPIGRRPRSAWTSRSSIRARMKSPS